MARKKPLKPRALPLRNLSSRHPGVSPGVGKAYEEAAQVSFASHPTGPLTLCVQDGTTAHAFSHASRKPSAKLRAAWNNRDDATRDGAYGVAIATVEVARNLRAVSRAETLTGADYYLNAKGSGVADLEDAIRMEVSGTTTSEVSDFQYRVKTKLQQVKNGSCDKPGLVVIVGFLLLQVEVQDAV